jgi:hypothetical protein
LGIFGQRTLPLCPLTTNYRDRGFSEHDLSRMIHICGLDEGLD